MAFLKRTLLCGALAAAIGVSAPAFAATYIGTFEGNDCGGGIDFNNCYATQAGVVAGPLPAGVVGTPAIVKYAGSGGELDEVANQFPTVDGSEISITLGAGDVLSFTYTPGAGDPEIHYFSIKQGSSYALFYDAAAILSGSIDLDDYFTGEGYSHMTFYDTSGGTGGGGGGVPEPSTWAMMLVGFGGIGAAMRRRRRSGRLMQQIA